MNHLTLFEALIAAVLLVHLHLEYRIWIRREEDVFVKYGRPGRSPLATAKWAYWAKALWLILLMLLQYGGVPFRPAFVYSFLTYAVLMQCVMRVSVYSVLQILLGMACLAEWWLRRAD